MAIQSRVARIVGHVELAHNAMSGLTFSADIDVQASHVSFVPDSVAKLGEEQLAGDCGQE
jgi:hypothetical protein